MKHFLLTTLWCFSALLCWAQIEQLSYGPGYANQVYYSLSTGETTIVANESWDIAFGVGPFSAAVYLNEANDRFGSLALELYVSHAASFDDEIDMDSLSEALHNDVTTWESGAFNAAADGSAVDLGWGIYDFTTNIVNGSNIFVLRLRDSSFLKLQVESLADGAYNFKYAQLDGSNEVSTRILKSDFPGQSFAHYSFSENAIVDIEPENWDLLFSRYFETLEAAPGEIVYYPVSGVLSGPAVEVIEVDAVDPAAITYAEVTDTFLAELNVIGHDWKEWDGMAFQTDFDRVYFVKTASDQIYKVVFIDFEGSSTGIVTLERTLLDISTNNNDIELDELISIYPNPFIGELTVEGKFDKVDIVDPNGKIVFTQELLNAGNTHTLYPNVPVGNYLLRLYNRQNVSSYRVIKY